jgi:hypothetical protein
MEALLVPNRDNAGHSMSSRLHAMSDFTRRDPPGHGKPVGTLGSAWPRRDKKDVQ